jgi:DNA mismatch repair protein MutL
MSSINLLDEELINKIAAGEVIERPASVVKELVENSLDAQATNIVIEINDSGKKLIKVTDNGKGMSESDTKKCVLRHATSKIKTADDLFAINTLGFRGEALSSVAAVSRLTITTKQSNQLEAYNLVLEAGQVISDGILGAEEGTTIEVHDLFFNTPARKKFLKTDSVELRHIVDVITQYALINPTVNFKVIHENHVLLNSPAATETRNNIASVYGIQIAKELLEISHENNDIKVEGFISKPYQARNDKNQQVLFVNGRAVKNDDINKAIYLGFHSLLFVNKHPIYVLNISLDPQKIDVNVHPTKREIKIEKKEVVCKVVLEAVKETLQKHNLIPILDFNYEQQLAFGIPKKQSEEKSAPKYSFEVSKQAVLKTDLLSSQSIDSEKSFISEHESAQVTKGNIKLPPLKLLGQVHKTFFVAETEGGLLLIDQHVVQERVLYEKFMGELMNKNVAVQSLLKSEMFELTPAEKITINENKTQLINFGFEIEDFGDNSIILKTIPTIFGRLQPKELFFEVLENLKEGKNKLEQIQEEIITRMACRASVKAGDVVTIPQMEKLLQELQETNLPYTCPHGRAVLIKLTVDDLEKKFKRK